MTEATRTLPPAQPAAIPGGRAGQVLRALVAVCKPRIIELLLVTTLPVMLLARGGLPSAWLMFVTLAGGALAAGSANTVNCVIDRDIDALMRRTSRRPLVATAAGPAVISPGQALAWAVTLAVAATLVLGFGANWLAAALADAAILFYVFIYTLGLKRRTASNIVIGGAAGCFPVLVGWAAVTGRVGWPALVLFGVVFFWTPPHFWALAMKFRDDYAAAGVPMLPVVAAPGVVARKIVVYSWIMVATSLVLVPRAGWLYGLAAAGLGGWFLAGAHRLRREAGNGDRVAPMGLFRQSISYLTLLFGSVAITALIPFGHF